MPSAHLQAQFDAAVQQHEAGSLDEAIAAYQRLISSGFRRPMVYYKLWSALRDKGRFPEAIAAFSRFVAIHPGPAKLIADGADKIVRQNCIDEAILAYQRALSMDRSMAGAWNNLGWALIRKSRFDEALAAYNRAVALQPASAEFHTNVANALMELQRWDEALAAAKHAISLDPAYPRAHWTVGMNLLIRGHLAPAWSEFAYRWTVKEIDSMPVEIPLPRWVNGPPPGNRILVRPEQGLGDTIQFVRYIPMLPRLGIQPVVACQPELGRLLRTMAGIDRLLVPGDRIPAVDAHCTFMDLPRFFGTDLTTIPATIPYLFPDDALARQWLDRMPTHDKPLKVGLSWAGRPTHGNDHNRSIALQSLAPLAGVDGIWFCSLQKGDAARQAQSPPPGMRVADWTGELADFADTAALLANLDLLITVDTAVAHLAGAMGKPVWVLVPFFPDWRWMLDRPDSPWYPTMRLSRQPARGDWSTPIRQIAQELQKLRSSKIS